MAKRLNMLITGAGITIGKDPRNDVVVTNKYVSHQHAFISLNDGKLTIVNRNSTNGTEFSISGSEWIKVKGVVTIPFIDGGTKIRLAGTEIFDLVPTV